MKNYIAFFFLGFACKPPVSQDGSKEEVPKVEGPGGDTVQPHTKGTCSADGPDNNAKPQYSQSDLSSGALISGYVQCPKSCNGQILINAMTPPPKEGEQESSKEQNRLITQVIIDESKIDKMDKFSTGFKIRVPDKTEIQLQVVDDVNKDGFCSEGESFGLRGKGSINVNGSTENIELTVGVFPNNEEPVQNNNPDQNIPANPTTQPPNPQQQTMTTSAAENTEKASDPSEGPPSGD